MKQKLYIKMLDKENTDFNLKNLAINTWITLQWVVMEMIKNVMIK